MKLIEIGIEKGKTINPNLTIGVFGEHAGDPHSINFFHQAGLGRITAWKKSGGVKNKYRPIDFKRLKDSIVATVERLEYDPNRSVFIVLIKYDDGMLSYIITPQKLVVGDRNVSSAHGADIKVGNAMPIKIVPVGTIIHNFELKPGKGGQLARAAGSYAQLVSKDANYAMINLVLARYV